MAEHPGGLFLSTCEPVGIHHSQQCLPVFGPTDPLDYYHPPDQGQGQPPPQYGDDGNPYTYYSSCRYSYYVSPENGGFGCAGSHHHNNTDLATRIDVTTTTYVHRPPDTASPVYGQETVGPPLDHEQWTDGHQGTTVDQHHHHPIHNTDFDWSQPRTNPVTIDQYRSPVIGHGPNQEYETDGREESLSPRGRTGKGKSKRASVKGEDAVPKYQCMLCSKKYCRRSTLKTHLRHHSGERPYFCSVCGKTFAQAANLTAHKRIHTGEKPFSCPICCRPFSQSSSLVTHKRTHTGEKPYPCPRCEKAFTDSSTLTKHVRTHTGVKPYTCGICLLSFSQSGNLNRHMKTHLKQQMQ